VLPDATKQILIFSSFPLFLIGMCLAGKSRTHLDNNNQDEAAVHRGQDARVTRGRDARDT
jgi:hypothetical protein